MSTPSDRTSSASTVAFFDDFAAGYDDFYAQRQWWAEIELMELMLHVRPGRNDRIADIGCGTGRLTGHLASQASHVFACDLSAPSIAILQSKCSQYPWGERVTTGVASMTGPIDLPDGSLDAIYNMQAYMLVPPEGRRAALREAARLLRPGGRLYLQVYAYPTWILTKQTPKERLDENGVYYRCFERDELRVELQDAGWEINGLHPIVRWPQLRRLGHLGKWVELLAHRLPHNNRTRCGYWLAVATRTARTDCRPEPTA
jgi:SAM-dependent methyltransferase